MFGFFFAARVLITRYMSAYKFTKLYNRRRRRAIIVKFIRLSLLGRVLITKVHVSLYTYIGEKITGRI